MLYKVVPTLELVDETLTLKMTTAQVVETSVTVSYTHLTLPTKRIV